MTTSKDDSLRKRVIRLAHENPELRDHLLPLVRETCTKSASQNKKASLSADIFNNLIDTAGLIAIMKVAKQSGDKQTSDLLYAIRKELMDKFDVDDSTERAVNRLSGLVKRGKNWDPSLIRNNVFKIANELGMKLPSGMF